MSALVRNEGAKRAQLNGLAVAYSQVSRRCLDPHCRQMGDVMRAAALHLWNVGGRKNVAAGVRAGQLAILAVQPVKLSGGSNSSLQEARADMNGAIGHELGDDHKRANEIRPLDDLSEFFWSLGDSKYGRAAVAVLDVVECLLTAAVR